MENQDEKNFLKGMILILLIIFGWWIIHELFSLFV